MLVHALELGEFVPDFSFQGGRGEGGEGPPPHLLDEVRVPLRKVVSLFNDIWPK